MSSASWRRIARGLALAGLAVMALKGVDVGATPANSPASRVAAPVTGSLGRGRYLLERPGAFSVPTSRGAGHEQRVRRWPHGGLEVTVVTTVDVPRPSAAFPRKVPPDDPMRPWLGGAEAASTEVRELANDLVAGQADQVGASAAIVQWVSLNIRHADEPGHSESVADTLASRVASCVGRSRLTTALLRAAGLPARTVHGLVVRPVRAGEAAPFILHRFVQTHVDGAGWIPSDPGDSVHLVEPSHVILAFDDAPYEPEWQRELVVTALELPSGLSTAAPGPERSLALRAWAPGRRASTISR